MPEARLKWWFPHLGEFFGILVSESIDEDKRMIAGEGAKLPLTAKCKGMRFKQKDQKAAKS